MQETPAQTIALTVRAEPAAPRRSGACPFCLRKHLLKARGYARELAEDATREWEAENLLENLLLAEDHAEALGDEPLRRRIRAARLAFEEGASAPLEPLLEQVREKIKVSGASALGSRVVDTKAEGAAAPAASPAPAATTGDKK